MYVISLPWQKRQQENKLHLYCRIAPHYLLQLSDVIDPWADALCLFSPFSCLDPDFFALILPVTYFTRTSCEGRKRWDKTHHHPTHVCVVPFEKNHLKNWAKRKRNPETKRQSPFEFGLLHFLSNIKTRHACGSFLYWCRLSYSARKFATFFTWKTNVLCEYWESVFFLLVKFLAALFRGKVREAWVQNFPEYPDRIAGTFCLTGRRGDPNAQS